MIELLPFQRAAADQIADRYHQFVSDPARPRQRGYGPVPFYQVLQALTGAGKTPMLADAVAQMRTASQVEPIALWISKGRVVVEQTLVNLSDGGKYEHLAEGFEALALPDITISELEDPSRGLILLGTVGTFNSKERGDRRIFGTREDDGGPSVWEALIGRRTLSGHQRPLFIVYDEGHNLTDQQAMLLLELKPDALIIASATPRLPPRVAQLVSFLHANGYSDEELRTVIRSSDVVDAELVKREVRLGGYITSEEHAIQAMLQEFAELNDEAEASSTGIRPKCIYVCGTNAERGDELKPFDNREAPPIRVWRYLVRHCGVDPREIAVYCDLRVSSTHPLPDEFVLFRGGERDYAAFVQGGFRHVIFNLALQEGWDDPECYLAYIDKSMGSELQVEQVVGRVLRQPGARYYSSARLNGCGFYIHVDDDGVFRGILTDVQRRLMRDLPAIEVRSRGSSGARPKDILDPLYEETIPQPVLDTSGAVEGVQEILAGVGGYDGSAAARADGLVAEVVQRVGSDAPGSVDPEWKKSGDGLPVTARWIIRRSIDRRFPAARGVCDLEDPRFGLHVHVGSPAAKALERVGEDVVRVVLEHAELMTVPFEPYKVGPISVGDDRIVFKNAVHEAYSDLNPHEIECARALDALGWRWCRNPSPGGYALPLLKTGGGQRFFPDFVVWTDRTIWLIDPKGDHLIRDAAAVKLIAPDHMPGQRALRVCLITEGKWDAQFSVSLGGVTAWRLQAGRIVPTNYASYAALVRKVIGAPSRQPATAP